MHSDRHATSATERATCTSSDSNYAHATTDSTGSTNAVRATSADDGSEHFGCSKQRQWSCNYGVGHGDFGHNNLPSRIHPLPVFLLHD